MALQASLHSHRLDDIKDVQNEQEGYSSDEEESSSDNQLPWDVALALGLFTLRASPKRPTRRRTAFSPAAASEATAQLHSVLQRECPEAFQQLTSTGEPIDAAFLERWLTARGSVAAAATAIAAHASWRVEFVGAGGVAAERIGGELAARKVYLQGLDPCGCPIVLFQAARHVAAAQGTDAAMLLMCYALDKAVAAADVWRNPTAKVCCIFDLSGLSTRNLDIRFLLQLFDLLQTHYPERLSTLLFVNAPLMFWGVWRCVSPFVAPATRQKIAFLSGAAGRARLVEAVGAGVLPMELGGSAPLVPVDAACMDDSVDPARQTPLQGRGSGKSRLRRVGSGLAAAGRAVGAVAGNAWRPASGAAASVVYRLRFGAPARVDGGSAAHALLERVALTQLLLLGILLSMLRATLDGARRIKALALQAARSEASIFESAGGLST